MILSSFLLIFTILLWRNAAGKEDIITLSPEIFDSTLARHENILVVFFAPWCGHCKSLQSDLKRVVARLNRKEIPALVATFDGSMYPKFVDRRGITGFPTFYFYRYGVFNSEYVGERTDRHITDFITKRTSVSIVTRLNSMKELLAFCSEKSEFLESSSPGRGVGGGDVTLSEGSDSEDQYIYPYLTAHDQMKKEMLSFVLGLFPHRPDVSGPDGAIEANRSKAQEAFIAVATEAHDPGSFAITDDKWLLDHFEVTEDTLIAFGGGPSVSAQVIGQLGLVYRENTKTSKFDPVAPQRAAGVSHPGPDTELDRLDARGLNELRFFNHEIMEFLGMFSMPLITPFSTTTVSLIDSSHVKIHMLLFVDEARFGHYIGELLTGLSSLAHQYRGKLLFVQIASSEHQILSLFGLTADDYPVVMIADMRVPGNMRRYMMRDADTVTDAMVEAVTTEPNDGDPRVVELIEAYISAVETHIDDFMNGRANPSIFSAQPDVDIESSSSSGSFFGESPIVRNVVGMNFEELVMQSHGDVFLFIYVPWCAYCKAFETVLKELINHFTQQRIQAQTTGTGANTPPSVTIARLEGGANEVNHPGVKILGYPTLYLFLEGNKSFPIEYDGERSLTALVEFISHHQHVRDEKNPDWKLDRDIDIYQQQQRQLELQEEQDNAIRAARGE